MEHALTKWRKKRVGSLQSPSILEPNRGNSPPALVSNFVGRVDKPWNLASTVLALQRSSADTLVVPVSSDYLHSASVPSRDPVYIVWRKLLSCRWKVFLYGIDPAEDSKRLWNVHCAVAWETCDDDPKDLSHLLAHEILTAQFYPALECNQRKLSFEKPYEGYVPANRRKIQEVVIRCM